MTPAPVGDQRGSIAAADVAYYQDTKNYANTPEKINNRLILAPTCGRNGGEAGVVRGRAFQPRPDRDAFTWRASRAPARSFHLTPARLSATSLAGQLAGPVGSGVAVAAATMLQPACNHQTIEIVGRFGAVAGLQLWASRHVRVCLRVRTRAHMCTSNLVTLQPYNIIYIDQMVSGCSAVAARLRLQPALLGLDPCASGCAWVNILSCGYLAAARSGRIRGNSQGVRRKTFRDLGCPGPAVRAGRNGGFARFLRPAPGHVGRVMLDWSAYPIESMRFSASMHLPVRLVRGPSERARAGGHPLRGPCFRRPMADPIFRNWNRFWGERPKFGVRRRVGVGDLVLHARVGVKNNLAAAHGDNSGGTWGISCQ